MIDYLREQVRILIEQKDKQNMRYLLLLVIQFLSVNLAWCEEAPFPGEKSLFGDKFTMYKDGANIVVAPQNIAKGKPWVWRARFWGHQPQFDMAMLEKGYHVVYCDVQQLWGCPSAVQRWNDYYRLLIEQHGFAEKAVLEGMSRGGLIVYNWAIANPDKVAAIYADAPVMHLRKWIGSKINREIRGSKAHRTMMSAYTFKDDAEADAFKGYPVDNLKPLAEAKIPIIHVVGDADEVVPVSEHTAIAEERIKQMGGVIKVIHKKDVGHHPHSLIDPKPIVNFILKHGRPIDGTDSLYNPNAVQERMIWADSWLCAKAPELHVEEWITEKPQTVGKYILIQFWHTFSPPSLRMLPRLNDWHEKYKDELAIICISDEELDVVRKSTKEHIKFFSAVDTQNRTHSELNVWGLPHVIIIEPEYGFIIWEGFPLLPGYELTEKTIKKILAVGRNLEKQ
ncbi:thioredoxin-like domain-containing protein [Planctomycetota bacterium]